MGDECARPGIGVFHRMFSPEATLHVARAAALSEIPLARAPRYWGQSSVALTKRGEVNPNVRAKVMCQFRESRRAFIDPIDRIPELRGTGTRCRAGNHH